MILRAGVYSGGVKRLFEDSLTALDLARVYPRSLYQGHKNRELFDHVETYCMFIGYGRSGHSLIGSLLDAHPNIVVSHELGVLKYVLAGFSRRQIYYLVLENSKEFTKKGRKYFGYSYVVPNQWQGRFKKLQIIGDKDAGGATPRLRQRPWLLNGLRKTMGGNIRFLHVTRNPYDNIATLSKRRNMSLLESIEFYFSLCETVSDIRNRLSKDELLELRHDAFVEDTENLLKETCTFLGADASDDYLRDCAGIVFKSPRKTRYNVEWDSESISAVKQRMPQFPFLEGYSYAD